MIIRLGRALERDPQQGAKAARKRMREQRAAFNDAGIAIGGFLARPAPIDESHREPTLDEMQRNRGADDAGTEHDGISTCHLGPRDGERSVDKPEYRAPWPRQP